MQQHVEMIPTGPPGPTGEQLKLCSAFPLLFPHSQLQDNHQGGGSAPPWKLPEVTKASLTTLTNHPEAGRTLADWCWSKLAGTREGDGREEKFGGLVRVRAGHLRLLSYTLVRNTSSWSRLMVQKVQRSFCRLGPDTWPRFLASPAAAAATDT